MGIVYCTELMAYFIEGLGTSSRELQLRKDIRHHCNIITLASRGSSAHFATTLSSIAVFRPEAERSATQTRCIMYSTVTIVV